MILTGLHSVLLILSHSYFFYQYLLELDQHSMSVKYELKIVNKNEHLDTQKKVGEIPFLTQLLCKIQIYPHSPTSDSMSDSEEIRFI